MLVLRRGLVEPASIDERSSRSWPSAPPPPPRGYNCDFMLSCLVKIQDLVIVRLQLFSEKSVNLRGVFGSKPDRQNQTKSEHFRRISICSFFQPDCPLARCTKDSAHATSGGFEAVGGQGVARQGHLHIGEQENVCHHQFQ